MLFTLSVGLHNVPLAPEDVAKASPAYQVQTKTTLTWSMQSYPISQQYDSSTLA